MNRTQGISAMGFALLLGVAGCGGGEETSSGGGGGASSSSAGAGGKSSSSASSGSGSSSSASSGSTSSSSASSSSASSSSASSSSASSSSSSGGEMAATCSTYCQAVLSNCTGDNAQYGDTATCEALCSSFVQGMIGDRTGNSLECRASHAALALMSPATECGYSGLSGGDLDPSVPGGPGCGDGALTFCQLALATCTDANQVWPDMPSCLYDATRFPPSTTPFSFTKDSTGNTFNCRVYHLILATRNASSMAIHCYHIRLSSSTCN